MIFLLWWLVVGFIAFCILYIEIEKEDTKYIEEMSTIDILKMGAIITATGIVGFLIILFVSIIE